MANTLKFGNGQWATKVGSTLAYNDENGNFKPLPFNFTRSTSGTRVNKDGLIEVVTNNKPRIDFLNDSNGALLLEPTRSNLILNSEKLSLSPIKSGTFTNDFAISPDGTQNATKLTATNLDPYFYQPVSFAAASYTASIYIKGIGNSIGKDFRIVIGTNLSTDLIIPSEWTRFEYTATMSSGSANAGIEIPNPAIVGDEVLIWGWQVEQGSYATSYIPNFGTALGVTRSAETCSQTPPSGIIGQTEGTLYCEIDFKSKPEAGSPIAGIMTLNNNVTNLQNCIILGIERQSGGTNRFYPFVQVGNSTVAYITGGTLTDGVYKAAFAYKQNDFVLYVNGVQIGTDSSGAVPTTSQVLVGERFNNDAVKIADGIKDTKLYDTRLSNAELATLTSL
jgi:hypothetical protein